MSKRNIYKLMQDIKKDIKPDEDYHTGLLGEALIVASYKQMNINDLEKLRFILNKIIKKKKEFKRIADASISPVNNNMDRVNDLKK
jgi:hypothetical protein